MTEFDFTPPESEPTVIDMLAAVDVEPTWHKENRHWYFPGLVVGYGNYNPSLGDLMQDEEFDERLNSRDRHAVDRIVNNELHEGELELDQSNVTDLLGWYSERRSNWSGPSANIKLHSTYNYWRQLQKALDVDFDEMWADSAYTIWGDTIDWEWEYYMDTVIPEDYPRLDTGLFKRGGRSGGHLIYNVSGRGLTVGEAYDLLKLWEKVPEYLEYVAQEIVTNQFAYGLKRLAEEVIDEWREGEQDAVAEALRTKDFEAAAWHQSNLDAEKDWIDEECGRMIVWDVLEDEAVSEQA